jgi:hypothetical protein
MRKISFNPTSRRSSHRRPRQDRPGMHRTANHAQQRVCPGSTGLRHPRSPPDLKQAAQLSSLPGGVADLDHFRVQRRDRTGV